MTDAPPLSDPDPPAPFTARELRDLATEIGAAFEPAATPTEVVLLDVDPTRLHAYWSIVAADLNAARDQLNDDSPDLVLRFHDVSPRGTPGTRAEVPFDVEIQGRRGATYVDLWQAGHSYVADLGLRGGGDHFVLLARSNQVDQPPLGPSADDSYAEIGHFEPEIPAFPALTIPPTPDPSLFDGLFPGRAAEPPASESDDPPESPETPDVVEVTDVLDVMEFPFVTESEGFPLIDPSSLRPASEAMPAGIGATATTTVKTLGDTPAATTDAPPPGARSAPGDTPAPDAPATANESRVPPPPTGSVITLSSFSLGQEAVELEVHAEIHVFGRTRPGRRLIIDGRPVTVRPDGTFSLRRPLPRGAVVLPLIVEEESEDEWR